MASTYTKKDVERMIDIYTALPELKTVNKLSVLLNKPKKSIISKLVKEGVYLKKGYLTKSGETPITKLQLVRSIEDALDIKLPDLAKAPKTTLKLLSDTVIEQSQLLEDSLGELGDTLTTQRTQDEIFSILEKKREN